MDICRWPANGIYVFEDVRGGFTCVNCLLRGSTPSADEITGCPGARPVHYHTETPEEMLLHMREHADGGDAVTKEAFENMQKRIECTTPSRRRE